jgi:hypothetical protein
MIVTQAIVDLTAPKTPARQASEMSIQLGEQPAGRCSSARRSRPGAWSTASTTAASTGPTGKCLIIRLADHKCHSLTGFYVNDEYNPYTGDGTGQRYDDQLEIYFRSDTTNPPAAVRVSITGPVGRRPTSANPAATLSLLQGGQARRKHPGWPGGRPRFLFVIKGKLCYDPRLDRHGPGGSGAHRWDDPDTWEWSENAVICRYNFQRGVYANDDVSDQTKLLVGRGLSAEEAPPETSSPPPICATKPIAAYL